MRVIKKGFIYKPENESDWWKSHAMAPAAVLLDEKTIRVYVGAWDRNSISRISFIDVDAKNPSKVLGKSVCPVLDIGQDGCFDDNGVFPAHVYKHGGKIYLYYTGFQKLDKIAFSNFSGLAISEDGVNFKRVSQAPVMDRADEGLFTRAGTSVIFEDGIFKACYAVGSSWHFIASKNRPIYDVNYIESKDGINFGKEGRKIIKCNLDIEHGLGRPQIVKICNKYYVFYTRRLLSFKYSIGCAVSSDLKNWQRIDDCFDALEYGKEAEFDSEMIYFPCVLDVGEKIYLFYVGNGYGKAGFGYCELKFE